MTPRKKWPEEAEWARQDSICVLDRVSQHIMEAIDRDDLTPVERIKLLAKANEEVRKAQKFLRDARGT
jgi:hypothetical protein